MADYNNEVPKTLDELSDTRETKLPEINDRDIFNRFIKRFEIYDPSTNYIGH